MRRTPYQSLSALIMLTITFFIALTFGFFLYTSESLLRYFETKPQVIAFFELDTSEAAIKTIANDIEAKDYVTSVTTLTQEQALELYKSENQDEPLLLELVSAEILPASIEVSGANLEALSQIKTELEKHESIEDIEFPEDILGSLDFWTRSLRLIGIFSIAIFGFESLLIIAMVTGMKVHGKRQAIQIMQLLGASSGFIRGPFLMEGMLYGILGALLGFGFQLMLILYLTPWLIDFVKPVPLFPLPLEFYAVELSAAILTGAILGMIASSIAVKRMMKKS